MTPQTPQFGRPARRRVRAFDLGPNVIEHQVGPKRIRDLIWVDPQDVQDVLATFSAQDVALPLYREHKPEDGSFGAVRLERAPDGGIDQVFDYSPEGRALLELADKALYCAKERGLRQHCIWRLSDQRSS